MNYTNSELLELITDLQKRVEELEQRPRTLLSDQEIITLAVEEGMIQPFYGSQIKQIEGQHVLSFGLSSYGYDIRLGNKLLVANKKWTNMWLYRFEEDFIHDPKNINSAAFDEVEPSSDGSMIIPPHGFALGESVEYFQMPPDVLGIALGKSTYARSGLLVNMVTPLEPGWSGTLTIEIFNATPFYAKVYAGEGISQIVFMKGNMPITTYDQRNGKYMEQSGITLPRV